MNTILTIYKTLALKYGCTYTYDFKKDVLKIDLTKCKSPCKVESELRRIRRLSVGEC